MPIVAYVLIVTDIGKEHAVVESLEEVKGVTEVNIVYGEYDLLAKIEVETMRDLDSVITKIRKVEGITRTATLISA